MLNRKYFVERNFPEYCEEKANTLNIDQIPIYQISILLKDELKNIIFDIT
jgi:hypothetical protein